MPTYDRDWTDFPESEALDAKVIQIRVDDDAEITKPCTGVTVHGTAEVVEFGFDEALGAGEETALDALVAAYERETIDEMKTRRILELDAVTKEYMALHYQLHDQIFFTAILTNAYNNGMTNRATYIEGILIWAMGLSVGYFDPKKAAIIAATDKAGVEAVTFSLAECQAAFDDSDPERSLASALAIED